LNELIKINNQGDKQTTSARDLWEFLGRPWSEFMKWFNQYKDYGFIENVDYRLLRVKIRTNNPKNPETDAIDYEITIDMAKELAMLQKTEKGKEARQYFIEAEKRYKAQLGMTQQVDSKMLFQIAQALEEKEKQIALLTPAAEFGNAVSNNQGGILIRDYVKVLENDGIRIGQDKFFSWLHLKGYIYRQKGYKPQWIPYKQYVEQGLFRVKETPMSSEKHGDWISYTIRVTGKGQKYFYEKLKAEFKSGVMA
jgi:anti-repressor protein